MIPATIISASAEKAAAFVADLMRHPQDLRGPSLRGSLVREFEELSARHWGYAHCLSMCNATTALLTLATALEIGGKEIIAAPNTWPGSVGPFEQMGAILHRSDADASGNLLVETLQRHLTSDTCAVLAVDWEGTAHDANGVRRFCDEHHLFYIADTSLALAGEVRGDAQVISFGPGKPLSLGEGGALLANDLGLYERCLALSQHPERCIAEGLEISSTRYFINGRIHPLAALVGAACLKAMSSP